MPLKIIGAGLGRTGTRSLQLALIELGFPCFHMHELMQSRERVVHFQKAHSGEKPDWEAAFEGYTATVDYPAALYWRALMNAYPDAHVLLTVRPAEDWYRSTCATIYPSSCRAREAGSSELMEYLFASMWDGFFGGRFEEPAHAMAVFERHNAAVQREVPAERLTVLELGGGWQPLCAALGVPQPLSDYPNTNHSAAFIARMNSQFPQ